VYVWEGVVIKFFVFTIHTSFYQPAFIRTKPRRGKERREGQLQTLRSLNFVCSLFFKWRDVRFINSVDRRAPSEYYFVC